MKKVALYGFIFALLFNVWQYGYWNSEIKNFQKRITVLEKNNQNAKDSINTLQLELDEASYFNLETNQEALNYLENYDLNILLPYIQEQINDLNTQKNGNPLIPLDPINGNKFVVNKIKFINHRWLIGKFSNGEMWGEVLIKYYINKDETVSFETFQHVIFP